MATCLNFAVRQRGDDGNEFAATKKTVSMISKRWKRFQKTCNKGDSLENRTPGFDQYVILEDDGFEEGGAIAYQPTGDFPFDNIQDVRFVPQWSSTTGMIEPQSETAKDTCSISSSESEHDNTDTDAFDTNTDAGTLLLTTILPVDEFLTCAFPHSLQKKSDTMTSLDPPRTIVVDDIEEICGVSFLRPGDNNRRKKYRSRVSKSASTRHAGDSETEDSSSMSSIPEDGFSNQSGDTFYTKEKCCNNITRRSIRFSDEIFGQSLTTIHIIPWSEHEDSKWIPRPVRRRLEL